MKELPETESGTIQKMKFSHGVENRKFGIEDATAIANLETQMRDEFGNCTQMTCKYDIILNLISASLM